MVRRNNSARERYRSSQVLFPEMRDQKSVVKDIRNYLAGQVVGITRDEALLDEVLKCVFCRIEIERQNRQPSTNQKSPAVTIDKLYEETFDVLQGRFPGLFEQGSRIELAPEHVEFMDRALSVLSIADAARDLIGDVYEAFIGTGYRGHEGQFFTPKNAVKALVAMVSPQDDDRIIDPACGAGGFLLEAARANGTLEDAAGRVYGIDKDAYLARLARLRLAIEGNAIFQVECADSLAWTGNGFDSSITNGLMGSFSLVLTNPPFGSKIVALPTESISRFTLASKWAFSHRDGRFHETGDMANNVPPQVLFIERCLSLLAEGGRLGIVLPESVLSNVKYRYVVQYIMDNSTPLAVIGMPESLFKTSGKSGTHTKVCLVVLRKGKQVSNQPVFMAEAKWCGHDSRGLPIGRDDIPNIVQKYLDHNAGKPIVPDHTGFLVHPEDIRDCVLAPRLYNSEVKSQLARLGETHDLYRLGDLMQDGQLAIASGDELGKLAYGTGGVPFVRTSDISSWEIKVDPKHCVSDDLYEQYARRQDVRAGDILMVRDGTYLIGTCAMVTKYDERIVYQSHLVKMRVNPQAPFDNYVLLAALSSPPVISQIRSMSFTLDIIDSLGDRVKDIVVPIPRNPEKREKISAMVRRVIDDRVEARELARRARLEVVDASDQMDPDSSAFL